ncbi:DUF1643 domain-containing protein [Pseudogracilibacillus sp. SO10305]|uniref:DUF1643 domain-containing protein n=1 Tax=Pseudogracilibacillus sp. SO10305 TaxID=3098292 RepID=UPI00300E44D8
MVKELTANISTKIIEEDSGTHRYVLERNWSNKKTATMATILTLYPSTSELIITDTTTKLITNNIYKLGYEGLFSVNLFSKLNFIDSSRSKKEKRNYKTASNATNDKYIIECAKKSDIFILAYGSLPSKNKQVQARLEQVMKLLEEEELISKVKILTDLKEEKCFHPLSANVRNDWNLIQYISDEGSPIT